MLYSPYRATAATAARVIRKGVMGMFPNNKLEALALEWVKLNASGLTPAEFADKYEEAVSAIYKRNQDSGKKQRIN